MFNNMPDAAYMTGKVRGSVKELLCGAVPSHSMGHVDRVVRLSMRFVGSAARQLQEFSFTDSLPDENIVRLMALLHDVDDYKLFKKKTDGLSNAAAILDTVELPVAIKAKILSGINEIGFSARLKGIRPSTIEAAVVSDAELCDAMGVGGILRAVWYGDSIGRPFFINGKFPRRALTYEQYHNAPPETTMCLIFEKQLRLKDMLLTKPGYEEGVKRHYAMVDFLRSYFRENGLEDWEGYLVDYLKEMSPHKSLGGEQ